MRKCKQSDPDCSQRLILARSETENQRKDTSIKKGQDERKDEDEARHGTHLRRPAGPCSCDRSTGAPSRARDRSAYCRFRSRGCFGIVSRANRRRRVGRARLRDARRRKDEEAGRTRRGRDREKSEVRRKCRSGRIWGGGWWATGLHAAPRRPASLNIRPPLLLPTLLPHSRPTSPRPADQSSPPTRRQATLPASDSNLRSPPPPVLGGVLWPLRGVPREGRVVEDVEERTW